MISSIRRTHSEPAAACKSTSCKIFGRRKKNSRVVKQALDRVLSDLGDQQWGLNIGAGHTRIHPRVINLDLFKGENIDVVNVGTRLPFLDSCIDRIVSQEVLEHVSRPREYVEEAYRVLKPGGLFYCQIPFIIGYHPGPADFWRFTKEGLRELFTRQPWEVIEIQPTLGHGSGFYRILVEFMAVNASVVYSRLYKPAKGFCILAFYPLQWLDLLTSRSSERDRIPGGYYCIAKKPQQAAADSS